MNKKHTKLLVIVSISILLAVQLNHFKGLDVETVPSDFVEDEAEDMDFSGNGIEIIEPDFPAMDTGYFTQNLGQWEDHIQFLAKTSFGYAAFSTSSVYYNLVEKEKGHIIKIIFSNSKDIQPQGISELDFDSNYFLGNDPEKWVSQARSYNEVLYKDVWPGIDIIYYFKDGNLKYDIVVGKYSDPDVISFKLEGHKHFNVNDGALDISLSEQISITDSDLVAFYEDGLSVPIQFKRTGENTIGFHVQKINGKQLTIDPVIFSKSTFLGGTQGEWGKDVCVDSANNIIIIGGSNSNDFPNTTGAYQTNFSGAYDVVVTKMNEDASAILFSTYLGDWSTDYGYGIEVDNSDNIYFAGMTYSYNYPTSPGAFQETDPSPGFPDAYVTKLSSQGDQLLYSSYVGGTGSDTSYDIKVRNGEAYVVGNALSYDFPYVTQPVNNAHGTVFLFIMNQDGTNLTHTGFWGGWSNDFGYSLDIDSNGDVVVGGVTYSQDFPTTLGAYMMVVNDTNNAFVLKYRPSTETTIWSTYVGGDTGENIDTVYIDDSSDIYFAGDTQKPAEGTLGYPTTLGAFDRIINGASDIFVTKMEPDGTNLIYSTYIGGDGTEQPGKIAVDVYGNLFLTGKIDSEINFTLTLDCFDSSYNGGDDAFLLGLNIDGSNIIYSTFLGGNESDSGSACVFAGLSNILVVGTTASLDFPVTNGSYQTTNKGYGDIFLTKFRFGNFTYLYEGWNLISIPFFQDDPNIDVVLSSISGAYDAVQWYNTNDNSDHWKHNHASKSSQVNDLKNIDHSMGIWVHITQVGGVLFEYRGDPLPPGANIPLKTGWNLVGYPSVSEVNRDTALNNLVFDTHVDAVQWYDAETKIWHFMGPSDSFVSGRGYWIHSLGDYSWDLI